jgi:hypothetical protein
MPNSFIWSTTFSGVALVFVRVGARGAEDGAALLQDVAHVVDAELHDGVGLRSKKALPATLDANDLVAVVLDTAHGDGPDHPVETGCIPAAGEHPDPLYFRHAPPPSLSVRERSV